MVESKVFITSLIDAKEGCDVAIIDLPHAFLAINNLDSIHIVLWGKMAELMAMIESHT